MQEVVHTLEVGEVLRIDDLHICIKRIDEKHYMLYISDHPEDVKEVEVLLGE